MQAGVSGRGKGVVVAAVVLAAQMCVLDVRAADDGAAPIWEGLSHIVGLSKSPSYSIDYRERSKLVVPPKMDLPKPIAGPVNSAWPTDQDVQQARKLKELEDEPSTLPVGRKNYAVVPAGGKVTMSAVAGSGVGGAACLKDGVAVACPDQGKKPQQASTSGPSIYWNPLTWVGIQKKPDMVLGPEPDRETLTDPPQGYRAPVEGVGAKIKDN